MTLAVALESSGYGDMGIDIARHETRDKKHDKTRRYDHPHVASRRQQGRQRCPREFLHRILRPIEQQCRQCQRQQQVDDALGHHLIIYMAGLGTIALTDGHLTGTPTDAANDEKQVIHHGTADKHC